MIVLPDDIDQSSDVIAKRAARFSRQQQKKKNVALRKVLRVVQPVHEAVESACHGPQPKTLHRRS